VGVASALLRSAEDYLRERGIEEVALYVATYNQAARRLYAKLGYAEVAEVPRLGETCVLAVKELKSNADGTATSPTDPGNS
jgi:ribosomal protein S18 acetylase RimI-like enzyme